MRTITIKGIKSLKDVTIQMAPLTVLSGANASGKSSIIQTLLLVNQLIESGKPAVEAVLNGYHSLQLGQVFDLLRDDAQEYGSSITIDGVCITVEPVEKEDVIDRVLLSYHPDAANPILPTDFVYLNAERIGPRLESVIDSKICLSCGDKGEHTGNVLLEASKSAYKIAISKLFPNTTSEQLNIQVDNWMGYIFDDKSLSIKTNPINATTCAITMRNTIKAPNTGFGITYALPIVVTALLAKKGSLLVIENPESHLHPKAQSNMGFFIGMMVAAGVNILIETHSEHFINGVRRSMLSSSVLSHKDVVIHFFQKAGDNTIATQIDLDEYANMSDFPVDFFDQVRQDMLEIIQLAR